MVVGAALVVGGWAVGSILEGASLVVGGWAVNSILEGAAEVAGGQAVGSTLAGAAEVVVAVYRLVVVAVNRQMGSMAAGTSSEYMALGKGVHSRVVVGHWASYLLLSLVLIGLYLVAVMAVFYCFL